MTASSSPAPHRQLPLARSARLLPAAVALVACLLGLGSPPAEAGWRPASDQTFDVQLSQPFNLVRPVNSIALDLFTTKPEDIGKLRARGVATFCYIAAGFWESWRPDAQSFPATALGSSVSGWPSQRWVDLGSPALAPILEARLDLCRERGFDGALLAGLDQPVQGSGFAATAEQRLALQHRLAAAAHARSLVAGAFGDFSAPTRLVDTFDFFVADGCLANGGCAEALEPWRTAGKPAYLVAYTNRAGKMDRLCGEAAALGLQLIFKTQSLSGKLHRRCS
jgi:hypothetical protein